MAIFDPNDEDQYGQPPASVPEGDPRAGLYAYLAQQAAIRKQGQTVPSYEDVQRQAKDNAERSAANAFGASLQNSASMMGTLNGKRADIGGMADLNKSLERAGDDELAGNYQALSQRNRDVATEGAVYKDLSNPDLARQRLYAQLAGRNNLYDPRRDIADANNASRDKIAGMKINAARENSLAAPDDTPTPTPGTGNWKPVYPSNGADPYMIDSKTGQMRPLPKGFQTQKEKDGGEAGAGAAGAPAGSAAAAGADEPLSKEDQKIWDKLQKDTNPALASSRSDLGVNQRMISSADRVKQLGEQAKTQKGGLDPRQIHELAIATAGLVSGGGSGAAQSTVEALVPQTYGRNAAGIEEWLTSNPTGTDQQRFVDRMLETADRERHLANEKEKNAVNNTYQGYTLWDRAPHRMEHNYYRQMGDDAAYDEQGRYVMEPYQHGAAETPAVGMAAPARAAAPSAPGNGVGPVADAAQYQQDMADRAWGEKYGYTFEQAKAIRDKRRAQRGQ